MAFTAWDVLTDLGFAALLLLAGALVRARVGVAQRLFLPASVTAGLLGLALGPEVIGLIPFSDEMPTYPEILIAMIFGAIPLGQTFALRSVAGRVGALWSYSTAVYVLQWGFGLLVALLVLDLVWDLPDGFGLMLAVGWAGGFGTAAAVGSAFADLGWTEATSLGFTAATAGVVVCIVGGLALTRWGVRSGSASFIAGHRELPAELRTGLVPEERREPLGHGTISPGSLEPLMLHLGLVLIVTAAAYFITEWLAGLFPDITIPVFGVAFLVGVAVQVALLRTGAAAHVDRPTMTSVTNAGTDLLVTFGIAAIVPSVVATYAVPLALLLLCGLAYCLVAFRYLAPRMFSEYWFERGLFTWGWATASVATSIALLRMVDPKLESRTLDDYGVAYVPIAPVEVAMVSLAPAIVASGLGFALAFAAGSLALGLGALALAWALGWWAVGRRSAAADRR